MMLEPGTGSPIVEGVFSTLVVLLFVVIAVMIARQTLMMSLLLIMPLARMLSFIPPIRRWIQRKTEDMAAAADR